MHPLITFSRFNNNDILLKPSTTYVCTLHQDRLLIVITSSQLIIMYMAYCTSTMQCMLSTICQLVELDHCLWEMVFHFQDIKELFHVFPKWLAFQEPKYGNKLNELTFLLNSFTKNNHHFSKVFQPLLAHNCSFLACSLLVNMKYWPTTNPRRAILHFRLLVCFYQMSNLSISSFSLPLKTL